MFYQYQLLSASSVGDASPRRRYPLIKKYAHHELRSALVLNINAH